MIRGPLATALLRKHHISPLHTHPGSGTAVGFNPSADHLFLVGTEEGLIYKSSKAYTSHFLDIYHVSTLSHPSHPLHPSHPSHPSHSTLSTGPSHGSACHLLEPLSPECVCLMRSRLDCQDMGPHQKVGPHESRVRSCTG